MAARCLEFKKLFFAMASQLFSSLFIHVLDVTTISQKDHMLFSPTYYLCSKKLAIKR